MIAYDSRHMPDPAHVLSKETVALLREALVAQRRAGREPVPALLDAIRVAAAEARGRGLLPEKLLIQLKQLADEAGLPAATSDRKTREVREWLAGVCLRAYWETLGE